MRKLPLSVFFHLRMHHFPLGIFEQTLSKRHIASIKANEKRWSNDPIPIRNGSETDPSRNPIVIVKVKENIKEKNNKKKTDDILDLVNRTIS
jgi:hypothetical protein